MFLVDAVLDALGTAASMAWQIAWSLVLGFALSAVVQAVVRRESVVRTLGDARPATLSRAVGLGIASSSCSYAAVALARSLFRKGADLTAAIVFEIASTNLVIELGIILALLMGWPFTLAEYVGGVVMIVLMALFLRLVVRLSGSRGLAEEARRQAERGVAGAMEGHAAMDMSVGGDGPWWRRLLSGEGYTAVAQIFVMEWAAVVRDVVGGLLIAGAVAAWVPETAWRTLFATDNPTLALIVGPLVGPLIAVLSFVCSVGNVPLAAVLYQSGISFGGVTAFLYADLIIVPILLIYRKYYGGRMALLLLGGFYATMVVAGYVVEGLFHLLHLVPPHSSVDVVDQGVRWNYTSVLDLLALVLAVALVVRFARTGGREMLSMMGTKPEREEEPGGSRRTKK